VLRWTTQRQGAKANSGDVMVEQRRGIDCSIVDPENHELGCELGRSSTPEVQGDFTPADRIGQLEQPRHETAAQADGLRRRPAPLHGLLGEAQQTVARFQRRPQLR
jgi:hypothetical protein